MFNTKAVLTFPFVTPFHSTIVVKISRLRIKSTDFIRDGIKSSQNKARSFRPKIELGIGQFSPRIVDSKNRLILGRGEAGRGG